MNISSVLFVLQASLVLCSLPKDTGYLHNDLQETEVDYTSRLVWEEIMSSNDTLEYLQINGGDFFTGETLNGIFKDNTDKVWSSEDVSVLDERGILDNITCWSDLDPNGITNVIPLKYLPWEKMDPKIFFNIMLPAYVAMGGNRVKLRKPRDADSLLSFIKDPLMDWRIIGMDVLMFIASLEGRVLGESLMLAVVDLLSDVAERDLSVEDLIVWSVISEGVSVVAAKRFPETTLYNEIRSVREIVSKQLESDMELMMPFKILNNPSMVYLNVTKSEMVRRTQEDYRPINDVLIVSMLGNLQRNLSSYVWLTFYDMLLDLYPTVLLLQYTRYSHDQVTRNIVKQVKLLKYNQSSTILGNMIVEYPSTFIEWIKDFKSDEGSMIVQFIISWCLYEEGVTVIQIVNILKKLDEQNMLEDILTGLVEDMQFALNTGDNGECLQRAINILLSCNVGGLISNIDNMWKSIIKAILEENWELKVYLLSILLTGPISIRLGLIQYAKRNDFDLESIFGMSDLQIVEGYIESFRFEITNERIGSRSYNSGIKLDINLDWCNIKVDPFFVLDTPMRKRKDDDTLSIRNIKAIPVDPAYHFNDKYMLVGEKGLRELALSGEGNKYKVILGRQIMNAFKKDLCDDIKSKLILDNIGEISSVSKARLLITSFFLAITTNDSILLVKRYSGVMRGLLEVLLEEEDLNFVEELIRIITSKSKGEQVHQYEKSINLFTLLVKYKVIKGGFLLKLLMEDINYYPLLRDLIIILLPLLDDLSMVWGFVYKVTLGTAIVEDIIIKIAMMYPDQVSQVLMLRHHDDLSPRLSFLTRTLYTNSTLDVLSLDQMF